MNGSPRLPRIQVPSVKDQGSFDITLHRKDNEGFGFVILTSKSKPPPGGNSRFIDAPAEVIRQINKKKKLNIIRIGNQDPSECNACTACNDCGNFNI